MIRIGSISPLNFLARRLRHDRAGNFSLFAALSMVVVVVGVGGSIDFHAAYAQREKMQQSLDAGVLAAARKTALADQREEIEKIFLANFDDTPVDLDDDLKVWQNADKSVTATLRLSVRTTFMGIAGINSLPLAARASAIALTPSTPTDTGTAAPCITALGSSGQDVLVNSGANVQSTQCSMDVFSTANPAFIMNSGSALKFTQFCVKGTQYIKNGGTLDNLKTACTVHADPYAGTLAEPTVSSTCTTSGAMNGSTISLDPGVHCATTFNGSPTITFKPGLHIIKGRMIINSGATVIANGVTFYFPDTDSEIRANGGLTFTGIASTSGTYRGILMFEKTSNAANNANKTQYIFNGSKGETLEGVIYLPNRNVTYNSTTNVTAKISLVVNQMIFNSANWKLEPYTGLASTTASATSAGARLTE